MKTMGPDEIYTLYQVPLQSVHRSEQFYGNSVH